MKSWITYACKKWDSNGVGEKRKEGEEKKMVVEQKT